MSGAARRKREAGPSTDAVQEWWKAGGGSNARRRNRRGLAHGAPRSAVSAVASTLLALAGAIADRSRANARFRRLVVITASVLVAVTVVGSAVGVITLDNLVLRRSAELGKLEKARRELRTSNTQLAAQAALLSAPPRIVSLARKRLGMTTSPTMAQFIYLDPANAPTRPRKVSNVTSLATTLTRRAVPRRAVAPASGTRTARQSQHAAATTPAAVTPTHAAATATPSHGATTPSSATTGVKHG